MEIVLIGAGNLATRLGVALNSSGHTISCIFSKTLSSAVELGNKLGCKYTTRISSINTSADICIVAVSDNALEYVLPQLSSINSPVVHTAGSVSIDVLAQHFENYGVFYPLQTFSKEREVNFSKIPICVEANTPENVQLLRSLGKSISEHVIEISSKQRGRLHLSAVFSCNFVNHFYAIGEEILKEEGLDYNMLKPLIYETASKAMELSPTDAQTGPAARGDKNIIAKHLKMLKNHPSKRKLYKLVSESIHRSCK